MSTTAADFTAGLEPQIVHAPTAEGRQPDSRAKPEPASELSAWLAALASFFDLSDHPLAEAELAELGSRDFTGEVGVARQALRHCLSLALRAATGGDESGGGAARAHVEVLAALSDLCAVCDSLAESPRVGLTAWESLAATASRELARPAVAALCETAPPRQLLASRRPELLALCERISPAALGADVLAAFALLTRALDGLGLVEPLLLRDRPLKQSLPVFALVRRQARELARLLESRAARACEGRKEIYEALDAASYALGMELNKVYARELVGLAQLRHAPTIYARVENSFALLRDCFQQTLVGLARLFDPEFDAARLFTNVRGRLEQSLILREEVWALLEHVRRAGREGAGRPVAPLVARLRAFEQGPMRFLMFKDWESFERFASEVAAARGAAELGPVLHRFSTYLEALFNQINMRAALADHPFDFPPVADN